MITDEQVEAGARALCAKDGWHRWESYATMARAALSAVLPQAVAAEREECARVADLFYGYTGYGSEDENTRIGMFARGNRNARSCIATAIRARTA